MEIIYLKNYISLISNFTFVAFAQDKQSKEEYCTTERKKCTQQYLTKNSFGAEMVTPEGTKICWSQYRKCMGQQK